MRLVRIVFVCGKKKPEMREMSLTKRGGSPILRVRSNPMTKAPKNITQTQQAAPLALVMLRNLTICRVRGLLHLRGPSRSTD